MRLRKNSGSQQEIHVRCQIYSIKKRLTTKQFIQKITSSSFYNDFLIVQAILDSVPEHIFDLLEKELLQFDSKLKQIVTELNFQDLAQALSMKPIAEVLMKIEIKNDLLEDFLTCGGYYLN